MSSWSIEHLYLALIVAAALYGTVYEFRKSRRRRREEAHLDGAGKPVRARVVAVEPMQRELNGAAGHPVTVAFADGFGGERQVRLTSGLGGYVAREGTEVMIRLSPEDPHLLRAEAIVGPHGPYRTTAGTPAGLPSTWRGLLGVAALLVIGALVGGGYLLDGAMDLLVPAVVAVLGLGLLVGTAVAWLLARGPRQVTTGTITDIWKVQKGTRINNKDHYGFTVHFLAADGREVHSRHRHTRFFKPRNRQVRVRYDPSHPPTYEVGRLAGMADKLVLIIVGGGLLLGGGLALLAALA